jgi:hypothetical protein
MMELMNAQPNPYEPPRTVSHPQRAAFLEAPIRVAGQLSWSDAIHAFGLSARGKPWIAGRNPPPQWLTWPVLAICLLIGLSVIAGDPRNFVGYLLCVGSVLTAVGLARVRVRTRRQWREGTGPFAPFERLITQEGIEQSGEAEPWRPWSVFNRFKRSDRCVLLYISLTNSYLIFPRSLFPGEAEWQEFLHFLQAKLPEG